MKHLWRVILSATALVGACAPTTGIGSIPVEVLVVLDAAERNLIVTRVDSTAASRIISISPTPVEATTLAVRGNLAVVGLETGSIILVDIGRQQVLRTQALFAGPLSALAFGQDGLLYASARDNEQVFRIDPGTFAGDYFDVPGGPQGFGVARGRVYVVAGNRVGCTPVTPTCPDGASWLSTISNGVTGDSIPLVGPGNAGPAAYGPDGLLYVLSSGNGAPVEGRLSVVDPVRNIELASFGGFGAAPEWVASDGADRVLVLSQANGLMVFDSRERRVARGAGAGIPLTSPAGITADGLGRVYVIEQGACTVENPGRIRVFGTDLVERPPLTGGRCPIAVATTEIPADLLGLDD